MYNYAIYDNIDLNNDSKYKCDKELLNNELKINTEINEISNPQNLINEIYAHCFKEAYYYSWTYSSMYSQKLYSVISGGLSYYEIKEEQLIKEHCVVAALYTVQYLLYKDISITAPQLASGAKGSGHNYIIDLFKKIEKNKENIEIDFTKLDKYEYEKYESKVINDAIAELWELKQKNELENSYLGQIVNPIVDDNKKRKIPLFLSNFSYGVLRNINVFKPYDLIREINQENEQGKINNLLREYLYCANNITCSQESTSVDKVLFNYQKERMFNMGLMKICFIGDNNIDNRGLLLIKDPYSKLDNTDIELMKKCMTLPNAFSRNKFAIWFSNNLDDIDRHYGAEERIELLSKVIFPIYEKTFFISLYGYCSNHLDNDVNDPLVKMNNILTEYINNNNIYNLIDDKRAEFEDYFKCINVDIREKEIESKMYEMLEEYFISFKSSRNYEYKGNNYKSGNIDISDTMPRKDLLKGIKFKYKVSDEMKQRNKAWEEKFYEDSLKREISRKYCDYVFDIKPFIPPQLTDKEIKKRKKNLKIAKKQYDFKKHEISQLGFEEYFPSFAGPIKDINKK